MYSKNSSCMPLDRFSLATVLSIHGVHVSKKPRKCHREFDSWWGHVRKLAKKSRKSGKNLVKANCLLLTSYLWLSQCLVSSCLRVYRTVKSDVGNHNLGRRAGKSGNVGEFLERVVTMLTLSVILSQ